MTGSKALRMSIGPVQGFISSGRRTRDFWAGSFLLSWLSGVAMQSIRDRGGRITIPAVQDDDEFTEPTLIALERGRDGGSRPGPMVGTLVNHFRAEVPASFDTKDIEAVKSQVRSRFAALSAVVFEKLIEPALTPKQRPGVRARWKQQTNGDYFEILAVLGDIPDWTEESVWLEQRKMFRSHEPLLAEKGADRCPVHGELAELGGFTGQYEKEQQDRFWRRLRKLVATRMYEPGGAGARDWGEDKAAAFEAELAAEEAADNPEFRDTLEIRRSERLSGMALVKRLFPLLAPELIAGAIGWMPDHIENLRTPCETWNPQEAQHALRNWPSTAFVAAIPWIVKASDANDVASETYAENQYKHLGIGNLLLAERPQRHRIKGIDRLAKDAGQLPKFSVLDGTLHFERGLEKSRFAVDPNEGREIARKLKAEFKTLISSLRGSESQPILRDGPASTHYAMLDMDGDRMGQVFSLDRDLAERGSKALLEFASKVPVILRDHDGILIFAGADDVNAMLPIETALACAQAIRKLWTETMARHLTQPNDPSPTLSGSIIFADYQNALDDVRRLTHDRLERVAKEGMGRDALAIAVMKSGGVVAEWASSWDDDKGGSPVSGLFKYARGVSGNKSVASRLAYVARARFSEILAAEDLFDDAKLCLLFEKEMSDSALSGLGATNEAKAAAIVSVLRPYFRPKQDAPPTKAPRHVGGLLIARFLADNAMWSYVRDWEARA